MLFRYFPPFGEGDVTRRFKKIARVIQNDKLFSEMQRPISGLAEDLIRKLLQLGPRKRPSANEALQHRWITGKTNPITPTEVTNRLRRFVESQRLIRVVKRIIQHQLLPLEKVRIEALFRHFANQREQIPLAEMAKILRDKVNMTNNDEIKVVVNLMDLDKDGYISIHEFLFSLFPVP